MRSFACGRYCYITLVCRHPDHCHSLALTFKNIIVPAWGGHLSTSWASCFFSHFIRQLNITGRCNSQRLRKISIFLVGPLAPTPGKMYSTLIVNAYQAISSSPTLKGDLVPQDYKLNSDCSYKAVRLNVLVSTDGCIMRSVVQIID